MSVGVTGSGAAGASRLWVGRSRGYRLLWFGIDVVVGEASGKVNRPSLLGCLIGKAAALKIINDPGRERHISDFLTLAAVVRASDLRDIAYQPAERSHLANMLGHLALSPELMDLVPEGAPGVERLRISLS